MNRTANKHKSALPGTWPANDPMRIALGADADAVCEAVRFPANTAAQQLFFAQSSYLKAETTGESKLAEFWQKQVLLLAKKCTAANGSVALFARPDAETTERLSKAYLLNGLAGTAIAFLRGLPSDDPRVGRINAHASALLKLSGQGSELAGWLKQSHVDALLAGRRFIEAQKAAAAALDEAPASRYWNKRTPEIFLSSVSMRLPPPSSGEYGRMTNEACSATLAILGPLRERHGRNPQLYEVEAEIRRVYSVSLYNQNRLAEAAAEARKSVHLEDSSARATQTLTSIDQGLRQLRSQIQAAEAQVRSDPTRQLNPEAYQLKSQAERAILALDKDVTEDERALSENYRVALVLRLWGEAGGTTADNANALASGLMDLLSQIPAGVAGPELHEAVEAALPGLPALEGESREALVQFVRRLKGDRVGSATASTVDDLEANLPQPIALAALAKTQRTESLGDWWRATGDTGAKVGLVALSLTVVALGGAVWFQAQLLDKREAAFATLVSVSPSDNPVTVLSAARTYFDIPVVTADRSRAVAAIQAFAEALRTQALANPADETLPGLHAQLAGLRKTYTLPPPSDPPS